MSKPRECKLCGWLSENPFSMRLHMDDKHSHEDISIQPCDINVTGYCEIHDREYYDCRPAANDDTKVRKVFK